MFDEASIEVIIEKKQEGAYLIIPKGRLDVESSSCLEEKIGPLLVPSTKTMIFDMTNLSYIGSTGLAVIFNAKKVIEANKGTLVLTNLQPQIKKVFEIIKALPAENIFKSMQEADSYLDAMQRKEIGRQK